MFQNHHTISERSFLNTPLSLTCVLPVVQGKSSCTVCFPSPASLAKASLHMHMISHGMVGPRCLEHKFSVERAGVRRRPRTQDPG